MCGWDFCTSPTLCIEVEKRELVFRVWYIVNKGNRLVFNTVLNDVGLTGGRR